MPPSPNELFGQLRAALHDPSDASWQLLCDTLELGVLSHGDDFITRTYPYVTEHLKRWPVALVRVCPWSWVSSPLITPTQKARLLEFGHVTAQHVIDAPEIVTRDYDEDDDDEEHHYFHHRDSWDDPEERVVEGKNVAIIFALEQHNEPPDWQLHMALQIAMHREALQESIIDYAVQNGWHDSGDRSRPELWWFEKFWLADATGPLDFEAVVLDVTWRVNGSPYGLWMVSMREGRPVSMKPEDPDYRV